MLRMVGLILGVVLAGCRGGDENPILGTWQLDLEANAPLAVMSVTMAALDEIEFSAETSRVGTLQRPTTYALGEGKVLVDSEGATIEIAVLDEDHIAVVLGNLPRLVYRRSRRPPG